MAVPEPIDFGILLRRHRILAGLTQEEVAERSGVSQRAISDLERGVRRYPHRDTVRRLAHALKLTGDARIAFEAAARGRPVVIAASASSVRNGVEAEVGGEGAGSEMHAARSYLQVLTSTIWARVADLVRPERRWTRHPVPRSASLLVGVLVVLALGAAVYMRESRSAAPTTAAAMGQFMPWGWRAHLSSRFSGPSGIAVDKQGNLFVADTGHNRIEEFSRDGTLLASWGGKGTSPGRFIAPQGVAVDSRGNIFVADVGNGRVQELSSSGMPVASWTNPGLVQNMSQLQPTAIAVDPTNTVYVLDSDIDCVARLIPGRGRLGPDHLMALWCPPQLGSLRQFNHIAALAVGPFGDVYVSSGDNGIVARLSVSSHLLAHWQLPTFPGSLPPDPTGLAVDGRDNLYVVDSANSNVLKFSSTGKLLATWGQSGSRPGRFLDPLGAAVDAKGDVYVADAGNNRVQELSPAGTVRAVWSSLRPPTVHLDGPSGLAADRQGNVYVASGLVASHILKFSPQGFLLADWGPTTFGTTRQYTLAGLAVDRAGNVYATDVINAQVDKLSPRGRLLNRWGAFGNYTPLPGTFTNPLGVAVDRRGRTYIADTNNNRVQELSPGGSFSTQMGIGQLDSPHDVAVGANGMLYVVDAGNDRIVELSPRGVRVAQWGSEGSGPGQFMNPAGIAVDRHGNVYVVDSGTNRVSEFSSTGKLLAQWGQSGTGSGEFAYPSYVAVDDAGNVYVSDTDNGRIQRLAVTR